MSRLPTWAAAEGSAVLGGKGLYRVQHSHAMGYLYFHTLPSPLSVFPPLSPLHVVLSPVRAVPVPKYLPDNSLLLWLGFHPQVGVLLGNELKQEK